MKLRDKTILVISPQSWGKMHVAKHHYAIELAKRGNQVVFLNPPDQALSEKFKWENDPKLPGLHFLTYRPFFPLKLRFHFRPLFDVLMRLQIASLLRYFNQSIDVVWCFEPNLYSNLGWFKAKFNIYHPVDELFYDYQIKVGHSAQLILSVTHEILSKFGMMSAQKHFIHHGLADEFVNLTPNLKTYPNKQPIKVGYTGNLLRQDIDLPTFMEIVNANPKIEFHLWGAYQSNASNFDGALKGANVPFVQFLEQAPNVVLNGMVSPGFLAQGIQDMDAFLVCYDIEKDQSKGTNYHKIMEYLSTGKVIISNNITTYRERPDLVQMLMTREDNQGLPALFAEVIENLEKHNTEFFQKSRIEFALGNRYCNHINLVETLTHQK